MNLLNLRRATVSGASAQRRRMQSGQEIVEFALVAVLLVPRGIIPTGGEYIRRLTTRGRAAIPAAVPAAPPQPSDPAHVPEARG